MVKKRAKKYDKPLTLQPSVEWSDLIAVALQPEKKQASKAKRDKGKKK